jgi:hypothetical protein
MAEGVDTAVAAFQQAIDPAQTANEGTPRAPAPAPRDTSGRFTQTAERAEPLFSVRMVEGDPETGDTSDGGDFAGLRQREREIADGRFDQRAHREAQSRSGEASTETERPSGERRDADAAVSDDAAADDGHARADDVAGDAQADAAVDEASADEGEDADENAQYEITVDGEPQTVTLGELRDGYIRTATFHSRLNKVNEHKQVIEQENQRVSQMRDLYINGLQYLDEDIRGLTPQEPDWDREYEANPLAARQRQKQFQEVYGKLHQIRANRAWAIQNRQEEQDRASAKYAVEQFTEFVNDHAKLIKDEPSLQRVIGGMRKTALAEGFNEMEVAGVYDKRMLNVLFKAWLYDQGMAVRPQAALPGPNGKSLAPGSARPLSGSAGRRNVDEAQRQLARSGRMEDAETYFHRLLR